MAPWHHLATSLLALITTCAAAQDTPAACPAPHEVRAVHLYGAWRAQWADAPGQTAALVQLERHPELAESVRGRVERDGVAALVAGDVDEGDFTLEESRDGQRISANWIGHVLDGSCGKAISGVWTDADTGTTRDFVLRRQGGWR
jgi:hypothetical protein